MWSVDTVWDKVFPFSVWYIHRRVYFCKFIQGYFYWSNDLYLLVSLTCKFSCLMYSISNLTHHLNFAFVFPSLMTLFFLGNQPVAWVKGRSLQLQTKFIAKVIVRWEIVLNVCLNIKSMIIFSTPIQKLSRFPSF